MRRHATLAHIRQLCCLNLRPESLMPSLLRALREYVGADSAGFFWVDARGEMTNLYAERMLPPKLMKLYFERYYDGAEHPFRQAFMNRVRTGETVSSITPTPELARTAYYNEILRHLDAHHTLYAVIRNQGDAIGQLSLYRSKRSSPFTAGERAALNEVSSFVAHAVSRPSVSQPVDTAQESSQFLDAAQEGVVIVDAKGRVVEGASQSLILLSLAVRQRINRATPPLAAGDMAPDPVPMLVERLRRVLTSIDAPAPRDLCETPWGRFQLSAYALGEEAGDQLGLVAIHVRRQEAYLVKLAEAMHQLDLPPQQREVALLIAQGRSNVEIAKELGISGNTANYHVRQLFFRLDVHERGEALRKILAAP
jgi:DNA-binding CsgD family transcriptional regulator/GAF domain-containing protein